MFKAAAFVVVLLLAGCAGMPSAPPDPSACAVKGEASFDCQVERYRNVGL